MYMQKKTGRKTCLYLAVELDRTLDLIGTEASGTSVHMAGSTVNDSLDALDVGLPCTVGTSVGVGNLDTEGHALAAKITLSHFIAPPIWIIIIVRPSQALRYDTRLFEKKQALFYKFFSFFQKNKGCIPEDTPLYYLLATAPIPAPMRMHHILFCHTCLL